MAKISRPATQVGVSQTAQSPHEGSLGEVYMYLYVPIRGVGASWAEHLRTRYWAISLLLPPKVDSFTTAFASMLASGLLAAADICVHRSAKCLKRRYMRRANSGKCSPYGFRDQNRFIKSSEVAIVCQQRHHTQVPRRVVRIACKGSI